MTAASRGSDSAATVAVLGAGSWGTTFAKVVADAATASGVERNIRLWGRRPEVVEQINTEHRNEQYLKGITLPSSITASTDVAEVLAGAEASDPGRSGANPAAPTAGVEKAAGARRRRRVPHEGPRTAHRCPHERGHLRGA